MNPNVAEPDDFIHNPDVQDGKVVDSSHGSIFTIRAFANIGCLILLGTGLLMLFIGYPIISYVDKQVAAAAQTSTAPPPSMVFRQLVDTDTPEAAKKIIDKKDGKDWTLVFSDEFSESGRSFYPGDEPVSPAFSSFSFLCLILVLNIVLGSMFVLCYIYS